MNINKMRDLVLQGQIATVTHQIEVLRIYQERTNENMTAVITEMELHIARMKAMFTTIIP